MTDIKQSQEDSYFTIRNTEVSITDSQWLTIANLQDIISKVIDHQECSILLTSDEDIRALNQQFRQKNSPTNVLSFPSRGTDDYIGDIAIAFHTIEREAKEQDKDLTDHFIHMLVHGILHLEGYDHENDKDAKIMEEKEIEILADMGIENPYN